MIRIAPLIGILFGLIMLVFTYSSYKRRKFSFNTFLIWIVLWFGLITGILVFEQIRYITDKLVMIDVMDFSLYFSVLVLFAMVFLIYNATRSNQKKIEKIVESIALRDAKEKPKVKR